MKKMNFFAAFAIMMAMGNMNANANMRNARAGELHVNSSGVVYVSNSGHQHDYDYDREYNVRGSTALLDALGYAVKFHIDVQRRAPEDRKADKVVFAVITDGMENASHTFPPEVVRELVKNQTEEWGWEFLFLGANIDAVTAAAGIGIKAERAVNYHCDSQGLNMTYDAVNKAVSNIRKRRHVEDIDERGENWRTHVDRDYGSR